MKDPFRVYMWMLGQDVTRGALAAHGFQKHPHPQGMGSSIWSRGELHLHSLALWLERSDHTLVYHRERGRFFRLPPGALPPELQGSQRIPFGLGWRELWPSLQEHEELVAARYGHRYREQLLRITPPALRRHRRAWREAFRESTGPA